MSRADAPGDPNRLDRFVQAQRGDYERALAEVRGGQKHSHWMWYIFPQLAGLGRSETAAHYAIGVIAEAEAYLRHPEPGPRLRACAGALLAVEGRSAREILGEPDDLKLRSCATLFAAAPGEGTGSIFQRLLGRYLGGVPDAQTVRLIEASRGVDP